MPYTQTLPANLPAPSPVLSAIAVKYVNGKMIADTVMPRVPVDTPNFSVTIFNKVDFFTIPETKVGRTSDVHQIDYSTTQKAYTVDDHALDEVVPKRDQLIAAAYTNAIDPKETATEQISDVLALSRESRVANIIFNPATYAAGNTVTLSGSSQWSDFTNSNPLAAILAAKDAMAITPTQLVLGQSVWTALRQHPKVVSAIYKNPGQYGAIELGMLQDLLEIDEVVVGQGLANTQPKGQVGNFTRLWGKGAALLYKANVGLSASTPSFGITAQWGERQATEYFDIKKGRLGSDVVRVGEAVKEIVLATDFGYYFNAAVA